MASLLVTLSLTLNLWLTESACIPTNICVGMGGHPLAIQDSSYKLRCTGDGVAREDFSAVSDCSGTGSINLDTTSVDWVEIATCGTCTEYMKIKQYGEANVYDVGVGCDVSSQPWTELLIPLECYNSRNYDCDSAGWTFDLHMDTIGQPPTCTGIVNNPSSVDWQWAPTCNVDTNPTYPSADNLAYLYFDIGPTPAPWCGTTNPAIPGGGDVTTAAPVLVPTIKGPTNSPVPNSITLTPNYYPANPPVTVQPTPATPSPVYPPSSSPSRSPLDPASTPYPSGAPNTPSPSKGPTEGPTRAPIGAGETQVPTSLSPSRSPLAADETHSPTMQAQDSSADANQCGFDLFIFAIIGVGYFLCGN